MYMPFELMVVLIVALSAGCVVTVAKMILDFMREKNQLRGAATGASLTASELQRLMREAVEDANAPLRERLDAVERQQRRLTAGAAEPESERFLSA